MRIAVNTASNNNQPWVVNDQNAVFRWNWSINNWDHIPACATDIGVGTDDSVWVIGCTAIAGGHQIFKYNGDAACAANNCWTMSDGGATQPLAADQHLGTGCSPSIPLRSRPGGS